MMVLLSALSVAACESEAGDDAEGTAVGGTQVQDPDAGKESDADGRIVYLAYTEAGNEVRWINPATGAGGLVLSGGSRDTEVLRPFAVPR